MPVPPVMTGAADRADRRNVVVQAQAIQLVDRGIDDLAAALEIGVLAHFPFSGPDLICTENNADISRKSVSSR